MAQWTGKVIGGLLGMLTLGPLGAAFGLMLGHQYDAKSRYGPQMTPVDAATIGERFFRSTFQVMGHIAKADGRVSEQEIAAARAVMAELGLQPPQVRAAIACFTQGKESGFDFDGTLASLAHACAGRPALLRMFLELQVRAALAGNDLNAAARAMLRRASARLGVSQLELAQIEAVLRIRRGSFARGNAAHGGSSRQLEEAYRVLEASPQDSNEQLAKAYRRQLSRHHPDKLKANGLPESMLEHAKERTQQIIEAYELVRERRGI